MDLAEVIASLKLLSDDDLAARGFTVEGTFDAVDDPVLVGPDGQVIETWREGYPYDERLSRDDYERTKRLLQIELLKVQTWVQDTGQRLVVLFEGRDAAGKGGSIKRFMEHLNPRGATVIALSAPSPRESGQWFFQRYVAHLPTRGEIVLYDRSWYNRAVVEKVMGYCTEDDYEEFMLEVPELEQMLVRSGFHLIKLWFSVSRSEQITRFLIRRIDPVRQWKLSPNDLASLDRWDDYTLAKEAMFRRTHVPWAPWTVVRTNDKKRSRLEAMRFVLNQLDYPGKRFDIIGTPDPLIVGPPEVVAAETGETQTSR
jgi:polyphosphate kinase 2